jgi:uncharacterized alkaline shock family protein YloU
MTTQTRRAETETATETMGNGGAGRTAISDTVIAAIAGNAAQSVEGVVRVGSGNIMRAITGNVGSGQRSRGTGIGVEAGQKEAIFDINLTVEYGRPIPDIVRNVREAVTKAIEEQVGLRVKEINVEVASIEFAEQTRNRVE